MFNFCVFICRLNDIIVRVNDSEIQNIPHQVAVDALKRTGNIVNLVSDPRSFVSLNLNNNVCSLKLSQDISYLLSSVGSEKNRWLTTVSADHLKENAVLFISH